MKVEELKKRLSEIGAKKTGNKATLEHIRLSYTL